MFKFWIYTYKMHVLFPFIGNQSSNRSTKWRKFKINEREIQSARQGYTRGIWPEDCWARWRDNSRFLLFVIHPKFCILGLILLRSLYSVYCATLLGITLVASIEYHLQQLDISKYCQACPGLPHRFITKLVRHSQYAPSFEKTAHCQRREKNGGFFSLSPYFINKEKDKRLSCYICLLMDIKIC